MRALDSPSAQHPTTGGYSFPVSEKSFMRAAAIPLPRPDQPQSETAQESPSARRPRLLLDAARLGVSEYRRARDLPRLIGDPAGQGDIVARLADLEAGMEAARLAEDPHWSCIRHVELLIALLAERALRK